MQSHRSCALHPARDDLQPPLPDEHQYGYCRPHVLHDAAGVTNRPVAYLAGPEVFLTNAIEIGSAKVSICRSHGFDAVFPVAPPGSMPAISSQRGYEIFDWCVETMGRCNLVIANMTPFRGVSMDVGTAVEIGYMFGKGHPVFGYTNVIEDYLARVSDDSLAVESFGFADNLMCEGPVWKSGGSVVRTDVDATERFTDLRGFVTCVEQAVSMLGPELPIETAFSRP